MNGASPSKLQPALIGGVALGVASAIPFLNCLNCACCALAIGGGFLAAALYFKDAAPSPEPPYGDAAVLGALTGVIGAVTATIVSIPIQLLTASLGFQPDVSQLEQAFEGQDIPPAVQEFLTSMFSGGLAIGVILIQFVVWLFAFAIFAMIGAIIGVAVFNKKAA